MSVQRYSSGDAEQVILVDASGNPLGTALNPLVSSGGGGGGGAVTIADGADVAQGSTGDTAASTTVIGRLLKLISLVPAALVGGRFSVDVGNITQVDVSDEDTRLLGRVKNLDSTGAVVDLVLKGQLPAALVGNRLDVNIGAGITLTVDVSDRDARLLGRVKNLDSTGAVIDPALKGQLPAALVGGRLDVNLGAQGVTPLKAREDTAAMTWVSVKSAAPAIGAVQADTGALAAGDWDFDINLTASDTIAVGKGLIIEHRNAANGATLQTLGGIDGANSQYIPIRRYTLALNERIRVIAGTAAGAAASMYNSAIGRRVA